MGYADSSNLYAFCGGDPVNCSDPTGEWGDSYKKIGSDLLEIPGLAWKHLKRQGKLIDRLGRTERRDGEGRVVGVSKEWRPDTLAGNVIEGTLSSLWDFAEYSSKQRGRSPNERIANAVVNGAVEKSVEAGTRFYHADEGQQREMIVGGTVDVIEQILLARATAAISKTPTSAGAPSLDDAVELGLPERPLLAAPKTIRHHLFNKFRGASPQSQKYRDFFKKHSINVDDFTIEIPEGMHKAFIHRAGNNWTTRWKAWIDANPNASTTEVYQFGGQLMDEYGLSGLPIAPYK